MVLILPSIMTSDSVVVGGEGRGGLAASKAKSDISRSLQS